MDSKRSLKWRIDSDTKDENGNFINNIRFESANISKEEMDDFLDALKKELIDKFQINEFKVIKHECPMVESPKDRVIELQNEEGNDDDNMGSDTAV